MAIYQYPLINRFSSTSAVSGHAVVAFIINSAFMYKAMYLEYFGLQEKPFTISPDPRYLYMSEHHREALAHLLYGINSDGCLILLTGDVGTGKTTVCRSLLEQLPENTESAIIVNPKLSVQELLETICEELQIEFEKNSTTIKSYIDAINAHLLQSHALGRTTVLIIDEAQNLDMEVLEQLRLLTNLETDTHKLLRIILIGQPELQEKLNQPEVSQINQRITSRYHLSPLSRQDVYNFIQHRLIIAGGGRMRFFSDEALQKAYTLSNGIPRLINILCDRALLGAYVEEVDQVNGRIIEKAAAEVLGTPVLPEEKRVSRQPVNSLLVVIILILLGASSYLFYLNPPAGITALFSKINKENAAPVTETSKEVKPPTETAEKPGQKQAIEE